MSDIERYERVSPMSKATSRSAATGVTLLVTTLLGMTGIFPAIILFVVLGAANVGWAKFTS